MSTDQERSSSGRRDDAAPGEPQSVTPRGLAVWDDFEDYHGIGVTVSDASLATEEAVRVYVRDDSLPACALLTAAGARRLHAALGAWLARHEQREGAPEPRGEPLTGELWTMFSVVRDAVFETVDECAKAAGFAGRLYVHWRVPSGLIADAAFDRITDLLEKRESRLRKALEFYADESNYEYHAVGAPWDACPAEMPVSEDHGETAREALKACPTARDRVALLEEFHAAYVAMQEAEAAPALLEHSEPRSQAFFDAVDARIAACSRFDRAAKALREGVTP